MSGSWKVAYADFVTALMAFFLLMWILNMASEETKQVLSEFFTPEYWENVSSGAQGKNTGNISGNSGLSRDLDPNSVKTDKTYYAIARKLTESMTLQNIPNEARGITSSEDGVMLHVNADALFKANSADLLPEGEQVLDDVAAILSEYNLFLVVRGHADSSEKGNAQYPSAWELSSARATACLRYLINHNHISPSLLRAVAYGDIRPLVPNTTPENSAKNRRVEFNFHRPEAMGNAIGF